MWFFSPGRRRLDGQFYMSISDDSLIENDDSSTELMILLLKQMTIFFDSHNVISFDRHGG